MSNVRKVIKFWPYRSYYEKRPGEGLPLAAVKFGGDDVRAHRYAKQLESFRMGLSEALFPENPSRGIDNHTAFEVELADGKVGWFTFSDSVCTLWA